jgi:hypothetical protein
MYTAVAWGCRKKSEIGLAGQKNKKWNDLYWKKLK